MRQKRGAVNRLGHLNKFIVPYIFTHTSWCCRKRYEIFFTQLKNLMYFTLRSSTSRVTWKRWPCPCLSTRNTKHAHSWPTGWCRYPLSHSLNFWFNFLRKVAPSLSNRTRFWLQMGGVRWRQQGVQLLWDQLRPVEAPEEACSRCGWHGLQKQCDKLTFVSVWHWAEISPTWWSLATTSTHFLFLWEIDLWDHPFLIVYKWSS